MQIPQSIATYIILSSMSVLGASIQMMNLEIMSHLTSNTPGVITTYIERSPIPTPRQPKRNRRCAMFTKDSIGLNIFPVSWAASRRLTYSIPCRSACLTPSRSAFSTSWKHTNGSTSTMQSGYLHLLATTSYQIISHMRMFLNGMGRRWGKCASIRMVL